MPLVPYKRTPNFTADTVPAGLLRRHSTRAGTWGRIIVEAGRLLFRRLDETGVVEERVLEAGELALVAPEEPHEVEPEGEVRFYVEFCREQAR